MKRSNKITFFIVAILIFAFAYLSFFGISNYYGDTKMTYIKGAEDIRWGIDIQGGVEAIFTPNVDAAEFDSITDADMEAAGDCHQDSLGKSAYHRQRSLYRYGKQTDHCAFPLAIGRKGL